jgi:hypothetical protein
MNALPLTLHPEQTGRTVMRLTGFSNELCFRLYDEDDDNTLVLDIVNGVATISIEQFRIGIQFQFNDYHLDNTDSTPCIDKVSQGRFQKMMQNLRRRSMTVTMR